MTSNPIVMRSQGAAKVSIIMIGQQAIMDAYLCLLHLTAGILVGESYTLVSYQICSLFLLSMFSAATVRTLQW